jgi:hypothetical protein
VSCIMSAGAARASGILDALLAARFETTMASTPASSIAVRARH